MSTVQERELLIEILAMMLLGSKAVVLNMWVATPLGGLISDIYVTIYHSSKITVMK